jgi:hypothetical protein
VCLKSLLQIEATLLFYPENGGSNLLQEYSKYLPQYSVLHPQKSEFFFHRRELISFPLMIETEMSSEDVITSYKITRC